MALILFWGKIAVRRMIASVKSSPIMIVWIALVIGVFIYGFVNNYVNVAFDNRTIFFITPVLMFFSLLKSLKNHNLTPFLILYSKSKYNNKIIYTRYFLKQAFLNNVLLIIFCVVSYYSVIDKKYFIIIPGVTIFSVFISFLVMYLKYNIVNRSIAKTTIVKRKSNPVIKSILYDYLSSDFAALMVLCAALFVILTVEFAKDIENTGNLYFNSGFFIFMTAVFSLGFMGIHESIPGINWKFQAIVSVNDYKYHLKRTMLFIGIVYGWQLLPFILFIIIGSIVNWIFLLKYLYCLLIILFTIINIAFSTGNLIIKAIKSLFIAAITMWFSALPVVYLPVLLAAVFITFIKAKNEYREWSLI